VMAVMMMLLPVMMIHDVSHHPPAAASVTGAATAPYHGDPSIGVQLLRPFADFRSFRTRFPSSLRGRGFSMCAEHARSLCM